MLWRGAFSDAKLHIYFGFAMLFRNFLLRALKRRLKAETQAETSTGARDGSQAYGRRGIFVRGANFSQVWGVIVV